MQAKIYVMKYKYYGYLTKNYENLYYWHNLKLYKSIKFYWNLKYV
jgi:hypothetical protein